MKKILCCIAFTIAFGVLAAHEFWLEPERFFYRRGESMKLKFVVGENFNGENWSGNREKVASLTLHTEKGMRSLAGLITANKGDSLGLILDEEGTQAICFNSTNSFINLDAKEFNAYLAEDRLSEAADYRMKHHETDSAGREYYQRSVKTLMQVGDKTTQSCTLPMALPLDLVPLQNPYNLNDDDSLTIRVLFKGKPLAGQFMQVWHRNREIFLKVQYRTNNNGEFSFPVLTKSKWMVSTVRMERLKNNAMADWQSYWASITWGYK